MQTIKLAILHCIAAFTSAVDAVVKHIVQTINPKLLLVSYIFFNVIASVIAARISQDWITFFTISGYWLGLTALIIAFIELYRSRMQPEIARESTMRENARHRQLHYRTRLDNASRSLYQARTCLQGYRWKLAIIRMQDLIEHLASINATSKSADDLWLKLNDSIQVAITLLDSFKDGTKYAQAQACQDLLTQINVQLETELEPLRHGDTDYDSE